MVRLRSGYLSQDRLREAIEAVAGAFRELLGEGDVIAYYSFGCELHMDLLYKPMRVHTNWIDRFIRDSLEQRIVIPGISDFDFTIPESRLTIRFCHECDIHLGGDDGGLVQQLLALPPFSELNFEPEPGA